MLETVYTYTRTEDKVIERIVADPYAHVNHMVLPEGEALPIHQSNANLYMIIVRGQMTLSLDGEPALVHGVGEILNIPEGLRMEVGNKESGTLEFFVVKTPPPR